MIESYQYAGKELVVFQQATRWKKYFSKKMSRFIRGSVLEVGAGIGATTRILNNGSPESWTMVEPDEEMYNSLARNLHSFPSNTRVFHGSLADISKQFDTIIYVDVLEHVRNDAAELQQAAMHLRAGGHLIVLSPAFQFLFSEFDKAIGHHKRYSKKNLTLITPPATRLVTLNYLDTAGFVASVANRLILHQSYPSKKQVSFWDKCLIPISEITDRLFLYLFGKSILAIWEKT